MDLVREVVSWAVRNLCKEMESGGDGSKRYDCYHPNVGRFYIYISGSRIVLLRQS